MIARHTARLLDLLRRNTTERRRRRTDSALLKGRPDRFELEHRQLLATFIVNSVGDQPDYQPGDGIADTYMDSGQKDQNGNPIFIPSGLTTLRSAIQEANALGGMNTIQFNLGAGATIAPGYSLPSFQTTIALDATFTGFTGVPTVRIDGAAAGGGADGLTISSTATNSSVLGLSITGFSASGIRLDSVSGIRIDGNYIGLRPDGSKTGNFRDGVSLNNSGSNTIGTSLGDGFGNVISGNSQDGIGLYDPLSKFNKVEGNFIGTDPTGTKALGNGRNGVSLAPVIGSSNPAASFNEIGDASYAKKSRNIISGNMGDGIAIIYGNNRTGGDSNRVENNYIGTDITGTKALKNGGSGVNITGHNNTIGGTLTGAGNVISGHTSGSGIDVYGFNGNGFGEEASDNVIQGNYLGTDATGSFSIANSQGINIEFGAHTIVGGASPSARNVISGNTACGIIVNGYNALIQGNYIGTDKSGAGRLPNGADGVRVDDSQSTITANVISANRGNGVLILGGNSGGSIVSSNMIGTDATGSAALGNSLSGVSLGYYNFGGYLYPQQGIKIANNLISSNLENGIYAEAGSGDVIQGNRIGTDVTGMTALGNARDAIAINGVFQIKIGGSIVAGQGNLISGGNAGGIYLYGGSSQALIQGNILGLNASGTAKLGNNFWGLYVADSAAVTVGGTSDFRNVISGNNQGGMTVAGTSNVGTRVVGNYIGLGSDGTTPLGNGFSGVYVGTFSGNGGASGATISGNVIGANGNWGVWITDPGTKNNVVVGNYIGTDKTGLNPRPNSIDGVQIANGATGNTIGGTTSGAGNLISGNAANGVTILNSGTIKNVVVGNYIGTNKSGTAALGNQGSGVWIGQGAQGNRVGTDADGVADTFERNVISGNAVDGVGLYDGGTSSNLVAGNYVGTDVSGTTSIPNIDGDGVFFAAGASGNTVGGTSTAARNVLSGNGVSGIHMVDSNTTGNVVLGNYIGIDASGTKALPNPVGVRIDDNGSGKFPRSNTIGGTSAGAGNVISGNSGAGVQVLGGASSIAIRSNSIYNNGGLGIDLGGDGVTANHAGGLVSGPNGLLNYPVVTSVIPNHFFPGPSGNLIIVGTFDAVASTTYFLDVYASPVGDSSGHGEGKRLARSFGTFTNPSGHVNFGFLLAGVAEGEVLSVTATDPAGNTSEFSADYIVDTTPPTSHVNPLPERATSLSFQVSVTASDPVPPNVANVSGISSVEIDVSTDGGAFVPWAMLPPGVASAVFTAQSNHTYDFRSIATDAAGNVESKPIVSEAEIYVPDLSAPVTNVLSLGQNPPPSATFALSFSGKDVGTSGLASFALYAQVDGASPQLVGMSSAGNPDASGVYSGSTSYQAISDGSSHSYRFYTVGIDKAGNVEEVPASPGDVLVMATYGAVTRPSVTGFVVQNGAVERSFVNTFALSFDANPSGSFLATLLASVQDGDPSNDRIVLTRRILAVDNILSDVNSPVSLKDKLAAHDLAISADFGTNGIGGDANSIAGDGLYTLKIDLDNNLADGYEASYTFHRLLGDLNGDKTVDSADLALLTDALTRGVGGVAYDVNGDGRVNAYDRTLLLRSKGRTISNIIRP